MQEEKKRRKPKLINSYKYKHKKRKRKRRKRKRNSGLTFGLLSEIKFASCDIETPRQTNVKETIMNNSTSDINTSKPVMSASEPFFTPSSSAAVARLRLFSSGSNYDNSYGSQKKSCRSSSSAIIYRNKLILLGSLVLIMMASQFQASEAFCPFKCLCNDQSLSANCTQVPSITIVPMTLNPLLKHLTLNHLPMVELSNSLSVYRQLEYLNLNSNQLRQIKYQNFNFKSAPSSVLLRAHQHNHPNHNSVDLAAHATSNAANNQELNSHNEQLARHLKQAIDKSASSQSAGPEASANSEDEIRFHLRELDLGDNKIDQLGSFSDDDVNNNDHDDSDPDDHGAASRDSNDSDSFANAGDELIGRTRVNNNSNGNRQLKSSDLERLAPFLTLTRLEALNLSGNKLSKLHQHVFLGLIRLKELDLSRNNIEFIDKHALVGLIELEVLKLSQNKLARHLYQLSLAFCRAPTNELRYLDLSDNQKSLAYQNQEILLPNQMFICAPRLVSLRLDALKLRYIQVNAFDNLLQLETLNLSRNLLEQVPSDSLSYPNSNLSLSLRQLDLSDTLIEFVNAGSFSSLKNLQKLSMNFMQRLVSFDLAAMSVHHDDEISNDHYLKQNQNTLEQARTTTIKENNYSNNNEQENIQIINHSPAKFSQQQQQQLINDQLIELQLRHNQRLQSLHSSLATRVEQPKGRIKFSKLKLLDLQGALELRTLPLDTMIDIEAFSEKLRVDLSYVSKLNCSSCQMSWLVTTMKQQQQRQWLQAPDSVQQTGQSFTSWTPLILFDPYQSPVNSVIKITLASDAIGCSWPFVMPLTQLLELETSFAPLVGHCNHHNHNQVIGDHHQEITNNNNQASETRSTLQSNNSAGQIEDVALLPGQMELPSLAPTTKITNKEANKTMSAFNFDGTLMWLASVFMVCLLIAALFARSLATLALVGLRRVANRQKASGGATRSCEFNWRSSSSTTTTQSLSSPSGSSSQNNANSAADCSSSSILSTAAISAADAGQILYHQRWQQHQQHRSVGTHKHSKQEQQQQLLLQQRHLKQQTGVEELRKLELEFERSRQQQQLRQPAASSTTTLAAQRGNHLLIFNDFNNDVVGQIERAHRRGNLFSRFVGRLRGGNSSNSWRPQQLGQQQQQQQRPPVPTATTLASSWLQRPQFGLVSSHQPTATSFKSRPHTHIIENVVYGGDKILAGYITGAGQQLNERSMEQQHWLAQQRQGGGELDVVNHSALVTTAAAATPPIAMPLLPPLPNSAPLMSKSSLLGINNAASIASKSSNAAATNSDGGANFIKPAYNGNTTGNHTSSSAQAAQVAANERVRFGTETSRLAYANCKASATDDDEPTSDGITAQYGGANVAFARNQLIIESTSCYVGTTGHRKPKQLGREHLLLKQLEAIGTDPQSVALRRPRLPTTTTTTTTATSSTSTSTSSSTCHSVSEQQPATNAEMGDGQDLKGTVLVSATGSGQWAAVQLARQLVEQQRQQSHSSGLSSNESSNSQVQVALGGDEEQPCNYYLCGAATVTSQHSSSTTTTNNSGTLSSSVAAASALVSNGSLGGAMAPSDPVTTTTTMSLEQLWPNGKRRREELVERALEQRTEQQQQQQQQRQQRAPLLVDGHIYVTLDRPIKQQNGCDEYAPYERVERRQQSPKQEEDEAQHTTTQQRGEFEKFSPFVQESDHCTPAKGDYKSFEWSTVNKHSSEAPIQLAANSCQPNNKPLKVVDKFKSDQTRAGGQQRQFAEQLSKLSSSSANAASDVPAATSCWPVVVAASGNSSGNGSQNRQPKPIAVVAGGEQENLGPDSQLELQKQRQRRQMKIYDESGGSDFVVKNRKQCNSKKSKRGAPANNNKNKNGDYDDELVMRAGIGNGNNNGAGHSACKGSANDNVTGQSDYGSTGHNGGGGGSRLATAFAELAAGTGSSGDGAGGQWPQPAPMQQRHSLGQKQQQQLVADLNSSNVVAAAKGGEMNGDELVGQLGNGRANSESRMMDGSVRGQQTALAASKYDANHDDTAGIATFGVRLVAAANKLSSSKTGAIPAACDDDYVINGLCQQQQRASNRVSYGSENLDFSWSQAARAGQQQQRQLWASCAQQPMGVSSHCAGPIGTPGAPGNTGAADNNNTAMLATNNNAASTAARTATATTRTNENSIMIGQQKFVPNWAASVRCVEPNASPLLLLSQLNGAGCLAPTIDDNDEQRNEQQQQGATARVASERNYCTANNTNGSQQHPSKPVITTATEFGARDYLASKQKFCDSSSKQRHGDTADADDRDNDYESLIYNGSCNNSDNEGETRGLQANGRTIVAPAATIISAPASSDKFQLVTPNSRNSALVSTKTAAGKGDIHSSQNEIYSNQFYYCKPSASTLSRKRDQSK